MFKIFRIFRRKKPASKQVAKDRLKLILIKDKGMLPENIEENILNGIKEVIATNLDIESTEVEITISQVESEDKKNSSLVASIPIKIK